MRAPAEAPPVPFLIGPGAPQTLHHTTVMVADDAREGCREGSPREPDHPPRVTCTISNGAIRRTIRASVR